MVPLEVLLEVPLVPLPLDPEEVETSLDDSDVSLLLGDAGAEGGERVLTGVLALCKGGPLSGVSMACCGTSSRLGFSIGLEIGRDVLTALGGSISSACVVKLTCRLVDLYGLERRGMIGFWV